MDSPSPAPETPDATIRRLTDELREARDQQAAATGKVSRTGGEPRLVSAERMAAHTLPLDGGGPGWG